MFEWIFLFILIKKKNKLIGIIICNRVILFDIGCRVNIEWNVIFYVWLKYINYI